MEENFYVLNDEEIKTEENNIDFEMEEITKCEKEDEVL